MKPLVLFCPPEQYETLIAPILGPLFTYFHMVSGSGKRDKNTLKYVVQTGEMVSIVPRAIRI